MSFQDWTPVVINGSKVPSKTHKELKRPVTTNGKLNDNLEEFKNNKISSKVQKRVLELRLSLKLNRTEMAQRCNVKPKSIEDAETGKLLTSSVDLNKIMRFLNKYASK